jgi:hypothetical protein
MAAHLHVYNSVCTIALTRQQDKITMEVASIQSRDREAISVSCNTEHILDSQREKQNTVFSSLGFWDVHLVCDFGSWGLSMLQAEAVQYSVNIFRTNCG